jgi:hypothetical protein
MMAAGCEHPTEKALHITGRRELVVIHDKDNIVREIEQCIGERIADVRGGNLMRTPREIQHRIDDTGHKRIDRGDDM